MKGLGQNITIEHLKKNDDSHDGYEYDQDPGLDFGQTIIKPNQRA
jgi:hypothetical protein